MRFLIPIFVFFTIVFFPTISFSKDLSEYESNVDFCNEAKVIGDYIVFGEQRLTVSDVDAGRLTSTSKNLDTKGLKVSITGDSPLRSLNDLKKQLIYKTAISTERPLVISTSKSDDTQTIQLAPCLSYTKGDEVIVAPTSDARIFSEFLYWKARYTTRTGEKSNTVYHNSKAASISAWLDPHDGKKERLFYKISFKAPIHLKATYFAYKSVKVDAEFLTNKGGEKFQYRDGSSILIDKAGFYYLNQTSPKSDPFQTNIPVSQSDMIVIEHEVEIDPSKKLNEQLADFLHVVKGNAIYMSNRTDSGLEIKAVEDKLFGNNPNGDLLLLCELTKGKNSQECSKFR